MSLAHFCHVILFTARSCGHRANNMLFVMPCWCRVLGQLVVYSGLGYTNTVYIGYPGLCLNCASEAPTNQMTSMPQCKALFCWSTGMNHAKGCRITSCTLQCNQTTHRAWEWTRCQVVQNRTPRDIQNFIRCNLYH